MRSGMRQTFPVVTKRAPLWGALFVCGAFFLAAADVRADGCRPPGALQRAQVAKVVDGDTLRLVDGRSVRLIGVNAPELGRHGRASEPFAETAARHLARLVSASDGWVRLAPDVQARDRYGRHLAHAFGRDGRNWAAQLLAAGQGFAVAIAPNTASTDCLFAAERGARAAGKGLWRPGPWLDAGRLRGGGFALVRARVLTVERNRGGIWLTLEGDLVLRVAPRALARFDEHALLGLEGRVVEARGWVLDRRREGELKAGRARWLLPLAHPAMLERY